MSIFSSVNKMKVENSFLLIRYRTMMVLIGILYPLWREISHLASEGEDESFVERCLISIVFLVFGLLTYRSSYFRRNISTYFKIIIYIWFLQVFYLMYIHDFSAEFLLLGIVVIFTSGSSFLDTDDMLYYYLFCLFLTGGALAYRLDLENLSFLAGTITAVTVSYASLRSILGLFVALEEAKKTISKKNDEFVELSSAVQTLFLPAKNAYETERWSIAGFYRPVDGCGGDWWSYSENNSKLTLVMGDVTGHGPGSAMMTASVASYMHAIENESPNLSVPDTLKAINSYLIRLQDSREIDAFLMTLCAIQVDLKTKTLRSWCAGCPSGFLLKKDNSYRIVGALGSPMGVSLDFELGYEEHHLEIGDRLFIYTDGIMEAQIDERQVGEKRLLKFLTSSSHLKPVEAIEKIATDIDKVVTSSQFDDYTFALVDFK